MIIGDIEFPLGGKILSATLDYDKRWWCSDPSLRAYLEARFPAKDPDYSPAHGRPGVRVLQEAARALKGKVVSIAPDPRPVVEGRVY